MKTSAAETPKETALTNLMKTASATGKVFAVIGDPVGHSLSPAMHNAAFRKCGIDAVYLALRVEAEELEKAVAEMKATAGLAGFNVTAPHKCSVLPLLDSIDEKAGRAGAVNTVVNSGGRLCGFNTDVQGVEKALEKLVGGARGLRVVVLGAGGSARAVLQAVGDLEVVVMSRGIQKARELAESHPNAIAAGLSATALEEHVKRADLLVNATPVGLADEDSLVPGRLLAKRPAVLDLVYKKGGTKLVRDGLARGCRASGGGEVLLQQGLASFKLFTGRSAPENAMRNVLEGIL